MLSTSTSPIHFNASSHTRLHSRAATSQSLRHVNARHKMRHIDSKIALSTEANAREDHSVTLSRDNVSNNSHLGEPKRILWAGQDSELTQFGYEFLSQFGHQVFRSSNGKQCLQLLKTILPNVLILDDELKWIHGPQIFASIRAVPFLVNSASCPIILLSNDGPDWLLDHGLNDSEYSCLAKPFGFGELLKTLDFIGVPAEASFSHQSI